VSRGSAQGEQLRAPAAFLRAIARNLLIGARRSASNRMPSVEWVEAVDDLVAAEPTAFDDVRIDALRRCREKLRGKPRLAVELHYIEGLSYRESAERLSVGVNGVKALLSRARQSLRDCVIRQMQGDR
jgi:RNA polymerase sigma factor (sigma-70 family)